MSRWMMLTITVQSLQRRVSVGNPLFYMHHHRNKLKGYFILKLSFRYSMENLDLFTTDVLDRETVAIYRLTVIGTDKHPTRPLSKIHINISDVNDNFPQFTQAEYRCEIFENSPPSWVCDVLAIDADSGSYGTVQYNITEGNDDHLFTVDPESGFLSTTASLDRENVPEFNLTVEATEPNDPLHKDRATVIVVVLDRNDNAPRFSRVFLTEASEDSPVGRTVIQVTSSDDDTGANAMINYSIIDQSDDVPFTIDLTTGYITVQRPLDREMRDRYILKVNANDSAWSISTDVIIDITDVNDNRPVFSDPFYTVVLSEMKDKEYITSVPENSEIG
uniref:Cadherin domain-containing protein n=1 Tax=Sparus aurata TaxID=8175 RepID=A0A671Y0R7_SPAAU